MIVKDESQVIRRCLESVKPIIDYWVIVDTGSSDGTQEIIKAFMKDIPGELHERKWVNFGHNRNEALALAQNKCDYILFIDADEKLVFNDQFKMPHLDKDCYLAMVRVEAHSFGRPLLVKNGLNWSWVGVLHEGIFSPEAKTTEVLANVENYAIFQDGHRSQDPQKHLKDAQILEKALETEPTNSRYVYYLAQEYLAAQEYALALKNYEKRATMGGWDEEVFFSLYAVARLQEMMKMPPDVIIKSYEKAYQFRPSRPEPLFHLAHLYFRSENYLLSYALSKHALSLPPYSDIEYREEAVNDYLLLALFADSANCLRLEKEAQTAYNQILAKNTVPQEMREKITSRLHKNPVSETHTKPIKPSSNATNAKKRLIDIICDFDIKDLSISATCYQDSNISLRVKPQLEDIKELPRLHQESEKVIVFNQMVHPSALSKIPKEKLVFFLWEPWEIPKNYYAYFSRVYTWDDDLVDNVKFFKLYSPNLIPMEDPLPSFNEKKFCVMVAGSDVDPVGRKNDLYSERMRMVEFFETKPMGELEIYGRNWTKRYYRDYRFPIPGAHSGKQKISILKNYRFCICFENTKNINGYVTEKILDCFAAGCVPIYYGAKNIETYIPKNCFIDYRDFSSKEELYSFLHQISEQQYEQYINNIRAFLQSEQAQLFSPSHFRKVFYEAITGGAINSPLSDLEQKAFQMGNRNLAYLMQALRLQNPYPVNSPEYAIWNEQSQVNIPILIECSLFLDDFCKAHKKKRVLFSSRDCCLWKLLFEKMFPQYETIYFHTSRHVYLNPSSSYIEYARSVYSEDCVIVDGQGSGDTCLNFFKNHLQCKPTYLALVNVDLLQFRHASEDILKIPRYGIVKTSDGYSNKIEKINTDLVGTLKDFRDGKPIRIEPEYDLKFVLPSHKCIEKCVELLPNYSFVKYDRELLNTFLEHLETQIEMPKYVRYVAEHFSQ